MVSIVILTMNEEHDLANCLSSIKWCGDIHILDSGSTDKTISIANGFGVKTWTNTFESFGQQRNFALERIPMQNDWILFLDADEIVTEKFRSELIHAISIADEDVAGFYCCWKMMLDGIWLKKSDNFPKWQFRVIRKGRAKFTDFGHGQKEYQVDGKIQYLKEPYLHYGFSKGWAHWLNRHNKYSGQEAVARLNYCPPFRNVFSRNGSTRNPALKSWLSKMPGWPFLRFFQAYFFNLGFTEGRPGFIYCVNMAYYEFLIKIKIREIKQNNLAEQA
ncbi:MAG: glycosyltransferase family 2 protein [Mucilaginibacter sp.]